MNSSSGKKHHVPVLISSIINKLHPISGIWIDGTFGAGGYTKAILKSGADFVLGIDRDPESQIFAKDIFNEYEEKFFFANKNFSKLDSVAQNLGFNHVNGVILDLGVSSMQLDTTSRGFSFQRDAPLDMRMSKKGITAKEVLSELSESELADIFFKYGEEKKSRSIAKAIVRGRGKVKLSSTLDLVEIIEKVVGPRSGQKRHPATRCFQALRIYVNQELVELEKALSAAKNILFNGGYLVVVCFHSLEDRLVKNFLRDSSDRQPNSNRYFPEVKMNQTTFKIITQKPILPNKSEILDNPRASSAKCRIAVRTDQFLKT